MKKIFIAIAVAGFGMSAARADEGKNDKNVSKADQKFMEQTAIAGMSEVALSKVAAEKGTSEKVKTFAQHMIDDHTKAGEELKALAGQKSVTLPVDLDVAHKQAQAKLEKLNGAAFDKEYMKVMKADHEKVVASFKKESKSAGDADLKDWVTKTLPTLQAHLDMTKS